VTPTRPSAPPAVRWIARTLEDAGFETWAVGGAVRDVLQGRPAGDWDLTTRAQPDQVRRLFRRTVPLGVEHGTVGVVASGGIMYEVTTFRRDVETDGRHAVVAFADRVEDDLARRDFTINAMAWHPLRETLLDPFGGAADLSAGVLRCVGDPDRRFREDFLRVLRACRFAGRFGLEVEADTWQAMIASVGSLATLSAERVREELTKILDADPVPSRALTLYRRAGVLDVLYPEMASLADSREPVWACSLRTADRLPMRRPLLRLAALLRDLDLRSAAQLLVRLRLSNVQADETARRAGAPPLPGARATDADVRRWLSRVGAERVGAVARLELARARSAEEGGGGVCAGAPKAREVVAAWRRARSLLATEPPLSVAELAVDGRDLIRLGLRPGPDFRRILEALLARVLEDPSLNRRDLLEAEARVLAGAEPEAGA
jgi:tRNA nucleotidyltransferase (CCA-adding enzyme)